MPEDQAELMRVLYGEHASALWRYAMRLTGDRARAEDVVQETLLRAWQRPHVLDQSENSARAWLFTVARNLIFDDYRSARSKREIGTDNPPEQASPDATDAALDSWLIADALVQLSPEHRGVLVRSYYRGMSTHQIADDLEIPEGTVKSRMHYALRALRLILQEMGVTQ
ncbi:sigma-70 family RNA polymerase sigma factor [Rhodococcus spelaei]|uniref:RNA polymerase sigma factor n=1 Tax=Rhodococcus spelaei TaxID=2546320 RepID=A0A541BQS4_9NOCA|nr:sigma-70 family RNA polymerase sigma factor [Rhodococcus spelaei]TQF74670.1 sigma-70 family RNA polymerase sigma factor [Rhodococcus spelaei]